MHNSVESVVRKKFGFLSKLSSLYFWYDTYVNMYFVAMSDE